MQERVPPRGWIERRSTERRCAADIPLRILGAALCVYGNPTSPTYEQRGLWLALSLRVLTKPNRSRASHSRRAAPSK
ncbi:hypothetical protein [Massilia horti]|uniref:Uncharacterized protein n=1 Tax=Massilia horti TaxID=2562153 RepID=A0A4Y9SMU1_9BURK|nr:hypothetical protein [Massilia horti]TFW27960.1 hypothetical protein E4O92_22630 [Massilia horti]